MKTIMLIVILIALSNCKSRSAETGGDRGQQPARSGDMTLPTEGVRIITEADDRKEFETRVGRTIVVKLLSHLDGGYRWSFMSTDRVSPPTYHVDTSACEPNVIGCSGFETFTFEFVGKDVGAHELKFQNKRSSDASGEDFMFSISVKP